MKELIAGTFALNPEFSVDVKRVVAEGDLVAVHFHARMNTDPGLAFVDIFRVRDGKVVEFWDVMQEVSMTSVTGYEMF